MRDYLAGSSIDSLAALLRAAQRYASGESLKAVAVRFDVDARTLASEFRRAGFEAR